MEIKAEYLRVVVGSNPYCGDHFYSPGSFGFNLQGEKELIEGLLADS